MAMHLIVFGEFCLLYNTADRITGLETLGEPRQLY